MLPWWVALGEIRDISPTLLTTGPAALSQVLEALVYMEEGGPLHATTRQMKNGTALPCSHFMAGSLLHALTGLALLCHSVEGQGLLEDQLCILGK